MKEVGMIFSTTSIKAIEDNRKTQTRRIAKNIPKETHRIEKNSDGTYEAFWGGYMPDVEGFVDGSTKIKPPCQPGDVIWVRETWKCIQSSFPAERDSYTYLYKADDENPSGWHLDSWNSPMFMPKAAARHWLTVKDVRPERVQGITEEDAKDEGITDPYDYQVPEYYEQSHMRGLEINKSAFAGLWDSLHASPKPVRRKGIITHYESYPWDDIQEVREYRGKPWKVQGNPFVWVYTMERKV